MSNFNFLDELEKNNTSNISYDSSEHDIYLDNSIHQDE